MEKIKYNLFGLDTNLYKYILDNGLVVYLLPYENKTNYSMHYVTKFGSNDTEFIPIGEEKMVKVPDGIAHFLEHKMFESEDGVDPFTFAANTGTSCNASTYYKYTRYLFEGNKGFEENLAYLLKYVHSPYFTDKNVEKEKGIITEELLQYKDMVDVQMDNLVQESLFQIDPTRIDIGGTVDTIKEITKEDLYKTYQTFYQPSNMFLVISGKFDEESALKVIENSSYLNQAKTNYPITRKEIKEPFSVNQKLVEKRFNTQSTRVTYSVKISISDYQGLERYRYVTYFGMMLSSIFGLSSDFRERMKKEEKMTSFYYDRSYTKDYMILSFMAQSDKPEEFVEEVKKQLENIVVLEDDITRIKRVWISSEVMMIDDANLSLDNIVYDVIEFQDIIPNKIEIYKSMTLEELNKIVKSVDYSNSSTVIIRPKK